MNIDLSAEIKLPPKEMLSTSQLPDNRLKFRINYSSLSLINECLRKTHYKLNMGLGSESEGEALVFGSAIHKCLEAWYKLPLKERVWDSKAKELAEVLSYEYEPDIQADPVMNCLREFIIAMKPLHQMPESDKRCKQNGIKILTAFFSEYPHDEYQVAMHPQTGLPMVEQDFSFIIHEDETMVIEYFGRLDLVLRHTAANTIVPVDHKTTARIDNIFVNRIKPNHQYTGYIMGLRSMGFTDCEDFMVQGIQVEKHKRGFQRLMTKRGADDFEDLKNAVREGVDRWLKANVTSIYPMNAPHACGNFNRNCQFIEVCQVPNSFKQNIIESTWEKK